MALVASVEGSALAFLKSLGVILASEIGDKTFFIAAVMAMRNPRLTVGCREGPSNGCARGLRSQVAH